MDASAGAAGDMLLAAMVDLGMPRSTVRRAMGALGSGAPSTAGELFSWIGASRLPASIKEGTLKVWRLLAEAEGESHGCPWRQVRFHQLSRPEPMRNVVGFCAGLDHFRVRRVYTGPVPLGSIWRDPSGRPRREPGPTASRLLAQARLPVRRTGDPFEWTTPTGAALLAAFARPHPPPFRAVRIGRGRGALQPPGGGKMLRLILGCERIEKKIC